MTDQSKGLWITLFGVLFVVPDSLFVRLIDAGAMEIAFWRLLLAGGIVSLGILAAQGRAPFVAVGRSGWAGLVYGIGTGASGVLFVCAVSLTSVANVVFIIASLPVFAAIFSRVFLGERLPGGMLLTMGVVGAGVGIIALGSIEGGHSDWRGDVLALGVSALFAGGLTAARGLRNMSMVPAAGLSYLVAAGLLVPFVAPFEIAPQQWGLVLGHGVFIACSTVLLALGPRYIPSAEVGLLVLLESTLAPLLAWAVLREAPGVYGLLGGSVVVGALLIYNGRRALAQRSAVKTQQSHPAG